MCTRQSFQGVREKSLALFFLKVAGGDTGGDKNLLKSKKLRFIAPENMNNVDIIKQCIQLSHFFDNFQRYDWVWITPIVLALPIAEFTWLIRETRSIEGIPGPAVKISATSRD